MFPLAIVPEARFVIRLELRLTLPVGAVTFYNGVVCKKYLPSAYYFWISSLVAGLV